MTRPRPSLAALLRRLVARWVAAPRAGAGCDLCGHAPAEADGRCAAHFRIL